MKYRNRIVVDAEVMHGKPVIRGTRIPVYVILSLMAGGYGSDEVLTAYPDLAREDVLACLEYATELAQDEVGILESEEVA